MTKACKELCSLDNRGFKILKGTGFQNLAQKLFDAGRSFHKSSIQMKDRVPHPTTVKTAKI